MVAEATFLRESNEYRDTAGAAIAAGEVQQMNNGRAAVKTGLGAAASGDEVGFTDEGVHTVIKTATQVWIDGAPIWWDHSANAATCVPPLVAGDRDFYLGCAVGDVASAATSGKVDLNKQPSYIIDMQRDGGDTAVVLTAGTPYIYSRGGTLEAAFSATAEAQKLDWLSKRSFALGSNWVLEAVVEIVTTADADVADLSIGVANATHASDPDSITESAFFHFDLGADLNIDAESDDGTTEVAATDTTIDFAAGTPVHLVLDGRDPSNVKYYINGVEVLAATADLGNIAAATGPLKALFHLEKSANDSPGVVQLDMLRVRTSERD
jgi:predicted RecA/RadA family phage recombinase